MFVIHILMYVSVTLSFIFFFLEELTPIFGKLTGKFTIKTVKLSDTPKEVVAVIYIVLIVLFSNIKLTSKYIGLIVLSLYVKRKRTIKVEDISFRVILMKDASKAHDILR